MLILWMELLWEPKTTLPEAINISYILNDYT
jgi:hypothetical protein